MLDQFGRKIDYMRVSVTDRCNLRCRCCMPEVAACEKHEDILRYEEILRVCRAAVDAERCRSRAFSFRYKHVKPCLYNFFPEKREEEKKVKKVLPLLLALCMLLVLAACGRQAAPAASQEAAEAGAPAPEEPVEEAKEEILLAMGNSDVPVGQYTQKILAYYELSEEELANAGLITYGTNVKEVTTQVAQGSVSCGVVYCTDAFSAGLTVVDSATKDMCGQVIYPAAVMKNSAHPEAARAFLDYLRGEDAMAVFSAVGFSPVSDTLPVAEAAETEPIELYVFAAASMTETLQEIKASYEALHPNVTLVFNFDSSGTLKTQIQEGAECDLFISAGQKQMNQLDITASADVNTEGLDFVLDGSRINLLENKVSLVVPEGNPAGITSFDGLAEALKAALG